MTTIVKSINDTTVHMLSAIGTVANSVANTVNTAASSLDMLDAFIQSAKMRQVERITTDDALYVQSYRNEAAIVAAKEITKLTKELSSDSTLEKAFAENLKLIEAAHAARTAPKE